MRDGGISDDRIREFLEDVRPRDNALDNKKPLPIVKRKPKNLFKFDDAPVELYLLANFLSEEECTQLSQIIDSHLHPSSLTYDNGDGEFRTSMTADLCYVDHPLVRDIDLKICRTLGINQSYGEGIQAQRYEVGGQFKPHLDTFNGPLYDDFCHVRGQRTWTFMVYLNEVEEGGNTNFVELGTAINPSMGTAVFWNNLNKDGSINEFTRHAGEPVIKGHKSIITKWFRVMGRGKLYP